MNMNERKIPWSIKGVADDAREAARAAAEAEGLTVGAWLDLAIRNTAGRELGAHDRASEANEAGDRQIVAASAADEPLLAAIRGIAQQIDDADARARASVEPLAAAVDDLRRRLERMEGGD